MSRQEIKECVENPDRPHVSIDAFEYIRKNGVTFDRDYPLRKGTMPCLRKKRDRTREIEGYKLLLPGDEENLKLAVAVIGPVSVSMKATENFMFYREGVFYDPTCAESLGEVNHAVLLVGYGTDPAGVDFWIIQNNFGTEWGENGFGKMARNTVINCGIASAAVFPVILV